MPKRKRKNSGGSIASLIVVILAILGVYYVQTGSDPTG